MAQSLTTKGVKITVEVFYQPDQSLPMRQEFVFAYRITLQNDNAFSVQLLRRQWYIFDSVGEYSQVEGEGVVGQQPVLTPGETYTYVSGCHLKSDMGKMWGHYSLQILHSQELIKVEIPKFEMIAPMKGN
ncbi:MAG: Co2+/Mg2+ efflux protein ApaG [Bacteroidetes bacterium]|nr:MAG: Co2+/Mg2+ efflux protein ApaG [Bacteroidota bacterium]